MSNSATQERTTSASTPPPNTSQSGKNVIKSEIQAVGYQLEQMRPQFAVALPSHIPAEKFERTVLTAINLNPALLQADRRSLFNACSKAASDGLLPDGRDGALVIFNTKEKDDQGHEHYIKKVQWMPMVAGIIKKARQSGEITALGARIVYQKEIDGGLFKHKVVDGVPKVDHEPILWGERGKMVLVYSFVQFRDGTVDFEFMHADDVAKIRNVSRAKDSGPWAQWTEEMWKKSAIRRHAKRLPISSELFDAISRDDEMTEYERQRSEAERTMLENARAQLGAPLPALDNGNGNGEVIDAEVVEAEETPLARGLRLLDACKTVAEVNDLSQSIAEEVETDAELAEFDQYAATRRKEILGK